MFEVDVLGVLMLLGVVVALILSALVVVVAVFLAWNQRKANPKPPRREASPASRRVSDWGRPPAATNAQGHTPTYEASPVQRERRAAPPTPARTP